MDEAENTSSHRTYYGAAGTTVTWIVFLFIPYLRNITGAILVGMLVGTYQAVSSNLTVDACLNLTDGKDRFAIGHQQMVAVWITDKVAHIFGKKENSIENLKFPGFLKMFEDNITATSTLMLVFFGTIMQSSVKISCARLTADLQKQRLSGI